MTAKTSRNRTALVARLAVLASACVALGTAWHEIVGHGLVGVLLGGRIAWVDILGVRIYPAPEWVGTEGFFGQCEVVGLEGATAESLVALAGSMSTWAAALVATALLGARKWAARERVALLTLSLWWVDLFTYTLPSFGLRRFVFFGRRVREPFDAAVALGIPGPLFQAFVVLTCAVLAVASTRSWFRFLRPPREAAPPRLADGL